METVLMLIGTFALGMGLAWIVHAARRRLHFRGAGGRNRRPASGSPGVPGR